MAQNLRTILDEASAKVKTWYQQDYLVYREPCCLSFDDIIGFPRLYNASELGRLFLHEIPRAITSIPEESPERENVAAFFQGFHERYAVLQDMRVQIENLDRRQADLWRQQLTVLRQQEHQLTAWFIHNLPTEIPDNMVVLFISLMHHWPSRTYGPASQGKTGSDVKFWEYVDC